MNELEISPDDPRLTAYALGELAGDERAAIEAALRRSSDLRAAMDEIRATTNQLQAALAAEAAEADLLEPALPMPLATIVSRAEREAVMSAAAPRANGRPHAAARSRNAAPAIPFPRAVALFGGLAAACFAAVFVVREYSSAPAVAPGAARVAVAATSAPAPQPVAERPAVTMDLPAVAKPEAVAEIPAPVAAPENARDETVHLVAGVAAVEPTVAPAAETTTPGVPLLEQVRSESTAAIAAVEPLPPAPRVRFDPLPPQTGPLLWQLGVPQPPVGLPTTAREPPLPAIVASTEEASARGQAMVQPQNDAMRIAQLRAAGSEADRARLLADARRGGPKKSDAARTEAAEKRESFLSRLAGRNRGESGRPTLEAQSIAPIPNGTPVKDAVAELQQRRLSYVFQQDPASGREFLVVATGLTPTSDQGPEIRFEIREGLVFAAQNSGAPRN